MLSIARLAHRTVFVVLQWSLFGCSLVAQGLQEPTFRSESNVVLVPALVRDRSGEIVYGLQASDFVIQDDGFAQSIHLDEAAQSQAFSLVVAIQVGRRGEAEFQRMKGLSAMLSPMLAQGQNQAAVVFFDSEVHPIENFTSNSDVLARDLKQLPAGDGGAAILDAVSESVRLLNTAPKPRLRVLLLISETRDHGSIATVVDVVRSLGDSNVVVYTLAFSPAKANVLDTLRGNNNPDLHPEQTEVHERPDLLAPLLLVGQAMRKNSAKAIAAMKATAPDDPY
jgi:VWFA-related protein